MAGEAPFIISQLSQHTEGEIIDMDVEVFELFSRNVASQDLGMLDSKAQTVDLCINGKDVTIHQSPGVLKSDRAAGTTGAVVWRISVPFAEWISSPANILFQTSLLNPSSTVLELGAGVGIVGLLLAQQVQRYIITDQDYMLKLVHKNLQENQHLLKIGSKTSIGHRGSKTSRKQRLERNPVLQGAIDVLSLDWETDDIDNLVDVLANTKSNASAVSNGFDVVLACDCVFNESLIEPFVRTCSGVCALRSSDDVGNISRPTVCIIAQQLRSSTVFDTWMKTMEGHFRMWRVSASALPKEMAEDTSYVVHLALLRYTKSQEK